MQLVRYRKLKQKNMTKNRQLTINIVSSIVAFATNLLINFFLSPYIVKTLGVEANGYVSLANNFITYATLVTIALNSMAGRFITIKIHQGDLKKANEYYTSVFIGNVILVAILLIPSILCIVYLEKIINIPKYLIIDVKILFALLFINFFINTGLPNWGVATFVTNKIYLQSISSMQSNLLRVAVIVGLFMLFKPSVYFLGISAIATTIFVTLYSLYYKQKLLPELHIRKKYFDINAVLELVLSGIWNTITQVGHILLSGLDLLITNIFIGPFEMGMISLAKTLPNVITSLAGTLTSVFIPSLTIDYAKGDLNAVKAELKKAMKLTGILLTIPLSILIIFGDSFYSLWVPNQDAQVLQILSILTCFGLIFTSGIQVLFNVFTVTNKLKWNSVLLLISGIVSTGIVFLLLKTTNLGVYAVAGTSSFINLIRNMLYTVPFCAKYLKLKWNTFFPEVMYSILSVIVLIFIGSFIDHLFIINSWWTLIIAACITSILGLAINMMIVLNKDERRHFINIFLKKIKRFN
ncbi:lipopolysaccharide biosynthesis protein [Clostridium thermopalmarium]|uniref:Putative membrane protein EpsK n=1 Tax=Clostridium thermopalmarium DSM 5974 TaxID=1121340 RepID=A0A2T0AZ59_9CLOT|nr:lipopolysaccharide biosynthesis protein [Clostridium thermopalmarium]PRR76502.1 putative membrane protein EpsK [Clostridium thermopalmarium DSM 5974]PVZ28385.1 O-antigen/teichoic acid export membrane protein [Clostridium thermopalmarium DSM 5974]